MTISEVKENFKDLEYKIFPLSYVYVYPEGTPFDNPETPAAALILENKAVRLKEFEAFWERHNIHSPQQFENFLKENIDQSERTELKNFFPSEIWISLTIDFALYMGDQLIQKHSDKKLFWKNQKLKWVVSEEPENPGLSVMNSSYKKVYLTINDFLERLISYFTTTIE